MTTCCLCRIWTAEGGKAQFTKGLGMLAGAGDRPPCSPCGFVRLNGYLTFISSLESSSSIMWDQDLFPDLLLLVLLLNCRQLCCALLSCLSYSVWVFSYIQLLEKTLSSLFPRKPKRLLTSVGV